MLVYNCSIFTQFARNFLNISMLMPHLSAFFLGSFQVTLDDRPIVRFGYDKVRALLAYLIMDAELSFRRETLAALLWPDQSPKAARHSLSQAVHTLRQALEDRNAETSFILADRETLQFNPLSDHRVDALEFSAHLDEVAAHAHLSLEDCPECMRALESAVSLYRGEFLRGLIVEDSAEFEEWVIVQRERLHIQAVAALHALAQYYAFRGKYHQAQQFARRQVELEPNREEAHRQLMHILARSGQRSAALAQYQACRRTLIEELGVEPTRETQALYQRIRSAGEDNPHNLPVQLTPLVGRHRELTQISEYLAHPAHRLVTITGIGGVGKTRLALEAAREHIGIYPHGVYFVPLAAVASPDRLATAIASALGAPIEGNHPKAELLAYLRDKEMLLVLDNFDHLLDGSTLVTTIMQGAPHTDFLITSRGMLNIQGETRLTLEGLPFPEKTSALETIWPAVKLFVDCARRIQPDFDLSLQLVPHVARICQLTLGIPLAIEMAASLIRLSSCEQIATAIATDLDVLTSQRRDLPPRQRSVRAVFEYSWGLLPTSEQQKFARLAVFRGSFSAQAAYQVAGAPKHLLAAWVDKSLLQMVTEGRFQLHPLLAHYAGEKLAAAPAQHAAAARAHAEYYAHFLHARQAALYTRQDATTLRELDQESENLHAAWDWLIKHNEWDYVDAARGSLYIFYWTRNRFREGQVAFEGAVQGLQADAAEHPVLLARLQTGLAEFVAWQGDLEGARERLLTSISSLRHLQEEQALAESLFTLGICAYLQGDYAAAQVALEEALTLARCEGDKPLSATILSALANVFCEQNANYAAAAPLYEESAALYRQMGNHRGVANVLLNQGGICFEQGDVRRAEKLYRESLARYRQEGYLRGVAAALNNLAMVARKQEDFAQAQALVEESLNIKRQIGHPHAILYSLLELGSLYLTTQQTTQAHSTFLEMLQLAHEIQAGEMLSQALLGLIETALLRGQATRAAAWLACVRTQFPLGAETARTLENLYATAREALSPQELAQAEERGASLRVDDLLAEVTHV